MILLAKTLGLIVCGFGIFVAALPEKARIVLNFWKQDSRIYGIGMIRIALGFVILLAAPGAHVPGIAAILGIVFLLSGAVIFVIGPEKMKELLVWWESNPDYVLRLLGFIALSFGILIVYSL